MRKAVCWMVVCVGVLLASPVHAQNWTFDARNVGLGGVGAGGNVAVNMVDEQRPYRAIVLPFGLLQILPDISKLNPAKDDFDLIRAIEYTASPIHYIVGRATTNSGEAFITDIRNARLSRDLNVYRGITWPTEVTAEGLASPSWGGTIKLRKHDDGTFQGIYVGAGPYLAIQTSAAIDPALTALLASGTPIFAGNSRFDLSNDSATQAALAITGGYRARMSWAGGGLNGLYIGANYHYLKGFRYEGFDLGARLDTDASGLLTVNPLLGSPLLVNRRSSTGGSGFAVDMGVTAVADRWEVGFGVNGIANRIDWNDVERVGYSLGSLVSGGDFLETARSLEPGVRVELPVDVRASASYNADASTVSAEFANGYNGTTFRGGYEYRMSRVQLRAGGRYLGERFEPTGGAGFNFSDHFGMDVAAFATSANLERKRQLAIAVSLRFTRKTK